MNNRNLLAVNTQSDSTRRLFLKRSTAFAVAGGAAALVLGSTPRKASARFEEPGPNSQAQNFKDIAQHETAHVNFLVGALGKLARPKPTFMDLTQETFTNFSEVARELETTGVGAYLGALPIIFSREYVAAAGTIALVEARHAGYLNTFLGDPITAPSTDDKANPSFDTPLTIEEVVDHAGPLIKSLNGGPALTFSTTPSAENDIAILNFALALEFLEQEFYQKNVTRFYQTLE